VVKKTKKVDTLGMEPSVHRKKLEDEIEKLNNRIDDMIEDFGDIIDEVNKRLDKVCGRMGLPKS